MPEVRPIDANALREEIMTENYDNDTINNFLDLVDSAPTLDNEPVVHCKDCEFHYYSGAGVMFCHKVYSLRVTENHFCSWGQVVEAKNDLELVGKLENVRGG